MFKKWDGELGLDLSGSGQGQLEGCFECANDPSGFVKCEVFLEYGRTC
jgi:hypothetical protein